MVKSALPPFESGSTPRQTEEKSLEDYNLEENKRLLNEAKSEKKINIKETNSVDDVKKHRFNTHKNFKPCRNYSEDPTKNKCSFGEKCCFNHVSLADGTFICYVCGKYANTHAELMSHRKNHTGQSICRNFLAKRCKFSDETCWWSHPKGTASSVTTSGTINFASTTSQELHSDSSANSSDSEEGLSWTMVDAEVVLSKHMTSEKRKQIKYGIINTANKTKAPRYLARLYAHEGSSKYLDPSALFDGDVYDA